MITQLFHNAIEQDKQQTAINVLYCFSNIHGTVPLTGETVFNVVWTNSTA